MGLANDKIWPTIFISQTCPTQEKFLFYHWSFGNENIHKDGNTHLCRAQWNITFKSLMCFQIYPSSEVCEVCQTTLFHLRIKIISMTSNFDPSLAFFIFTQFILLNCLDLESLLNITFGAHTLHLFRNIVKTPVIMDDLPQNIRLKENWRQTASLLHNK